MKHNPLFVDSTKFKGERINAEIEVRGVQLREGERLQTKVILSDGQQILIEMECFRPQRFSGAVRLKYLEEVRFQHQILSGDEIIDSTAEKKFVANYTVMDLWVRRVEELKDQYIEELSFESLERELRASALRKMAGDEEDSDEMEVPQIKEKENKNPVKELEGYLDQIVQKEAKREEPEEKKEYGAADVSLGERIEEFSDDELSVEEIDVEHFPKEEMPVDEIEELQVKLTALLETQREKREAGFSKGRGMWSPPIESIVKERGEIVEIASGAFVTEANKISLASDLDIEEVVHENSQLSEAISNSDPDAEIEFGSGYENL